MLRAVIPYLIQGQVVFELAFGGLVLHTLMVLREKMGAGRPPSKSGTWGAWLFCDVGLMRDPAAVC